MFRFVGKCGLTPNEGGVQKSSKRNSARGTRSSGTHLSGVDSREASFRKNPTVVLGSRVGTVRTLPCEKISSFHRPTR
jgi:hypothetical protein